MAWLSILLALSLVWLLSTVYALFKNYRAALRTGLPIVLLPVNNQNIIWMIVSGPMRPVLEKYLPAWMYEPFELACYGWEFRVKESVFNKYGPAFILVTAGSNELSLVDPELASEVLKRLKDFPNTTAGGAILEVLGPNLIASDGEGWARQRRVIAPSINEKISGLVFGESGRQAREMLDSYVDEFKGVMDDVLHGTSQIAINVLGLAEFGISMSWKEEKSSQPDRMSYMEATKTVVENILPAAILPTRLLTSPLLGPSWHKIGHAKTEFPIRTEEMLENERKLLKNSLEPRNNLMSMLVRLSNSAKMGDKGVAGQKNTPILTDEEIRGNLFVVTSAGYDTTANTMAYSLALLCAYPEWQDWLCEEVSEVLGDKQPNELEYSKVFPHLPRCLALMLETLRLFPPLIRIARQTNPTHDVQINTSTKSYLIPKNTLIYINTVSLHLDPTIFGDDPQVFNPSRWLIKPSLPPSSSDPNYTTMNVKTMPKGTFLPWSSGPRTCPGQKMSQVEFVSVFMTIFRRYRCEAVKFAEGETREETRLRMEDIIKDSAPKLTLQMSRHRDLKVQWIER